MNETEHHYQTILSSVTNADSPAYEIGQLRGEIWKLCVKLSEFEFQPPNDPDYDFWWTTIERDGTEYDIVLACHVEDKPIEWFLWEVQVNGSNIYDTLSDYCKSDFLTIAQQEMTHEI